MNTTDTASGKRFLGINHHGEQGILFDSWREVAPFILFGGFALLVLLFGLLVRTRIKPLPKLI